MKTLLIATACFVVLFFLNKGIEAIADHLFPGEFDE